MPSPIRFYAELVTLDGLKSKRMRIDVPEGSPPIRLMRPVSKALWADEVTELSNTDLGFLSCRCYNYLKSRVIKEGVLLITYLEEEPIKSPTQ
jgi:hypothetical protein